MKILGIETSCDETAAAIIESKDNNIEILSNIVSSQIEIHKKYGGIVPEVAAREHVLNIIPVINKALEKAKLKNPQNTIDAIAITTGPGLITSLQAGIETAKSLALAWNIPTIAVNHIEGHIYANFINSSANIKFPAVILTVSGGHTSLILMKNHGKYETIGETRDDAAGEAFDKAAKLMGLDYPGGPIISERANEFKNKNIESKLALPRPMMHSNNFEFSFSGLKTAIRYKLEKDSNWKNKIPEYCYEFQQAVIDVLIHKTLKASEKYNSKTIMLTGGVSANTELRQQLEQKIKKLIPNINYLVPDASYTTDNATMIATAGLFKAKRKKFTPWQKLKADCNLKL